MNRLTYWSEENQRYEVNDNGIIHYGSITNGLGEYEDLEEKLQDIYESNVNIKELIEMFIRTVEDKDRESLKGFRILTNKDAALYDEWKRAH